MDWNVLAAGEFGGFIAWWKFLPVLAVLLVWSRLLTWVDKDAIAAHLPREAINGGLLFGLALAAFLLFIVPNYLVALAVFLVIFAIEIGIYLAIRNKVVGLKDLKSELAAEFSNILPKPRKKEYEAPEGQITLIARSGNHFAPPDTDHPLRTGYDALQMILAEPMQKGAETIDIVPSKQGPSAVKYKVDGTSYDAVTLDAMPASDALLLLKDLLGMNPEERRKIQNGKGKIIHSGNKHEIRVSTAGSSSGEQARIEIDVPARYQLRAENAGFSKDQLAYLQSTLGEPGLVVVAAPKGMGLTSLQYIMLRMHDAFIYHCMTIERDPPIELEGITQNKLTAGASPAEEAKLVNWVSSQEPDVLMVGALEAQQSALDLLELARTKRVYVGIRAPDVFTALAGWIKLVGDTKTVMSSTRLVIAGRLFRRLCDATKVPYQPDEATLKKLGVPAGKVSELYNPHFGPLVDAKGNQVPDTFCHGLGYKGRFGVYEMLKIDDSLKDAISQGGSIQLLRQVFRKQKQYYIHELALSRLLAGDVDVQEYLRVIKPPEGK